MTNSTNCTKDDEFAVVFNRSDGSFVKVIGPNNVPVEDLPINAQNLKKLNLSDTDLIIADPVPIKFIYRNPVCCIQHMGRLYCWC